MEEEEFYEIGINRQTDPFEFNNLINNPDYAPVIEYLSQWLPEGPNYLQRVLLSEVKLNALPCLENNSQVIKMSIKLYTEEGNPMSASEYSKYDIVWTNNITSASVHSKVNTFNMSSVAPSVYDTLDRIFFYVKVIDTASGAIKAFDLKYIYVNPPQCPRG